MTKFHKNDTVKDMTTGRYGMVTEVTKIFVKVKFLGQEGFSQFKTETAQSDLYIIQ